MNIVELIAGADECAFDQPCRYGNRVDGHAVYCHNDSWSDAPRKCHHTWFYGRTAAPDLQDEACHGFKPNPDYKENA